MKKFLLLFFLLLGIIKGHSQTDPTLAVGLEALTMNKGSIDVEALTEIIMEKQKELKGEALKRFMLQLFPESNYTTKFYLQNSLNILLNEKNPHVIEKEILELTTNYALTLGVTYALVKSNYSPFFKINESYLDYMNQNDSIVRTDLGEYLTINHQIRGQRLPFNIYPERNLLKKEISRSQQESEILDSLSNLKNSIVDFRVYKNILNEKNKIERLNNKIFKIKQRRNIPVESEIYNHIKKSTIDIYNDINLDSSITNRDKRKLKRTLIKLKLSSLKNELKELEISSEKDIIKKVEALSSLDYTVTDLKEEVIEEINCILKRENISFDLSYLKDKDGEELIKEISKTRKSLEPLFDKKFLASKNQGKDFLSVKKSKLIVNQKLSSITPKLEIPFGILLDVVSSSLSNMESLKKKGFFKNEIDYRGGDFFLQLSENNEGRDFKESLDILKLEVDDKIRPYIQHYDVIKEFLKNNSVDEIEDITASFNKQTIQRIRSIANLSNIEFIEDLPGGDNVKSALIQLEVHKIISEKGGMDNIDTAQINGINDSISRKIDYYNIIKQRMDVLTELEKRLKDFSESYGGIAQQKIVLVKRSEITIKDSDSVTMEMGKKFNEIPLNEVLENKDLRLLSDLAEKCHECSTPGLIEMSVDGKETKFEVLINEINEKISKINNSQNGFQQDEEYLNQIIGSLPSDPSFYNSFLIEVLERIERDDFEFSQSLDTVISNQSSKFIAEVYQKVKDLSNNQEVTLQDLNYFEDNLLKELIELKVKDPKNIGKYGSLLAYANVIIPLMKIKVVKEIGNFNDYNEELLTLFTFIGNLDKLDRAETFESVVDMLRTGSEQVENNLRDGHFKDGYIIFINAVKKYTLVNSIENYVEIDVPSFLNDLDTYYNRNDVSRFSLYLSLGLNENIFLSDDFRLPDSGESINNIGFASEKLGLEFRLHSFRRFSGYKNVIKKDVYLNKRAPFLNDLYAIVYGSGLLYSLANTSTNENFDFSHLGFGVGLRFYNALDVNLILGLPFVKDSNFGDHAFMGLGLDIPLGEYLERLGK